MTWNKQDVEKMNVKYAGFRQKLMWNKQDLDKNESDMSRMYKNECEISSI